MSSRLGESIAEEEASIVAEEVTTVEIEESTEVAAVDTTDASRMPLREKKASLSTIRSPEVNREAAALTEVVAAATTSMKEKQDLRVLKLNIRNIMKEPNMRVATEVDVVVVAVTEVTEVVAAATASMRKKQDLRLLNMNIKNIMKEPSMRVATEADVAVVPVTEVTEVVAAATASMREKQDLRMLKVNIRSIMKEPNTRVATEADVVVVVVTEAKTLSPERKTHSIATSKERVKVVRAENLSDSLTSLLPKESRTVSKNLTSRNLTIPEDPGLTVRSRFHLTQ